MVDMGSLVDLLFWDMFQRIGIDRDRLKPVRTSLVGLVKHGVQLMGTIYLALIMGKEIKCSKDGHELVGS